MRLPQGEGVRGGCHFSALLDIDNQSAEDLRLELLTPEGDAWATVELRVPARSRWAEGRTTPLWLPRVKAVRLVRASDGLEVWRQAPWGEGGVVTVRA
jgi:hypothetical protein